MTMAAMQVPYRVEAPLPLLSKVEPHFMPRGPRVTGVPVHGRPAASLAFVAGRCVGMPARSHLATLVVPAGRGAGMPVGRPRAREVSS